MRRLDAVALPLIRRRVTGMPLTGIKLVNFKCFADSGDIPIAPLTVIFGRNNTGKSSILRSLLLLRQTLDSPGYGQKLNLTGPYYPAGSYEDVVHQHRKQEPLKLQFSVSLPKGSGQGDVEFEFRPDEPRPPRLKRLAITGDGQETVEFRRGKGAGGPFVLWIGGKKRGGERSAGFAFGVNLLPLLLGDEPPRIGRPSPSMKRSRVFARVVLGELQRVVREVRAIGAFRPQPLRQYDYRGGVSDAIDIAGQRVVDALIEDATARGKRRGRLFHSVNQWLKLVGRVCLQPIRPISNARRIYEIRLKDTDSGRWANYADVGFGIGQALPVIVEGLRAPAGATLLVEEPEIHLHPDAQLAMGDFLIDLAMTGKRVIVETHSDNLLLRIRHSVLRSGGNGAIPRSVSPDDVSILFVDKEQPPGGTSAVRRLTIDPFGQILNWPPGFMEEATEERLGILEGMAAAAESGS